MKRDEYMRRCELAYWRSLLEYTLGNVREAASIAGMTPAGVYERLVTIGMRRKDLRRAHRGKWHAPKVSPPNFEATP